MIRKNNNLLIFAFSPWLLAIACSLLVVMLGLFGVSNYQREVELIQQALSQKGLTLVRFINSSTRESMRTSMLLSGVPGKWLEQMQNAMQQATEQPGVDFVALVTSEGKILARTGDDGPAEQIDAKLFQLATESQEHNEPVIGRMVEGKGKKAPKFQMAIQHLVPEFLGLGGPDGPMYGRGQGMRRMGQNSKFRELRDNVQALLQLKPVFIVQLDVDSFNAPLRRQLLQLIILFIVLVLVVIGGTLSFFTLRGLKGSQDRLDEMRAFNELVVSSLPIGLIASGKRGTIQVCNSAALGILGKRTGEVLGRNPDILGDNLLVYFHRNETVSTIEEVQIPQLNTEQPVKTVQLQTLQLTDSLDQRVGTILLLRDITEVKDLEKELQRSERMAALGKMAAGVAHELRNPLSSIKGLGLLLKSGQQDGEVREKTADMLVKEVERLNRSIGELLEYARPAKLNKQVADIRAILEKNISLIAVDAAAISIDIDVQFTEQLPGVPVDVDKINQVFLNVLLNAVQAMPNGGRLDIQGSREEHAVVVTISDQGCGIDPDSLPRIFDPYFTTKPEGTGLGLALSLKIIEEHDGSMRIASTSGHGTTVTITLPIDVG